MSLYPLVGEKGMDYMYNACSLTARRGALDWAPKFEAANKPVFQELYARVKDGSETRRTLEFAGRPTYREDYQKETDAVSAQEVSKLEEMRCDDGGVVLHPLSSCCTDDPFDVTSLTRFRCGFAERPSEPCAPASRCVFPSRVQICPWYDRHYSLHSLPLPSSAIDL